MALTFDKTVLQDATWTQDNNAQATHTTRWRVTGFTQSSYYAVLNEMVTDVNMPQIGDVLDALFPQMLLRAWEVVEYQCGAPTPEVVLELTYTLQALSSASQRRADKDGPVIFRQRSITSEWTRTEDKDGNPMELDYKGCKSLANVTILRPQWVYACERYEEENPYDRAAPLLATVNSVTWNGRNPRTVLFYDMSSDTRDDGTTYFVNYSFLYDPLGHDREVFYIGQDGTTPVDYKTEPGATLTPEVYPEGDFGPLNITLP